MMLEDVHHLSSSLCIHQIGVVLLAQMLLVYKKHLREEDTDLQLPPEPIVLTIWETTFVPEQL